MRILERIDRRYHWYKGRFQVNNPVVGRAVEMLGNKVRMDGMSFSVDCPQISRAHKSTLAFGLHEMEERELVAKWVPPDIPIIELGGGLGVVSCVANRKLNDRQAMVVVEANPGMISVLTKNREINGCHFGIENKALAYDADEVDFYLDGEFVGSSTTDWLNWSGTRVFVKATTVAQVMENNGFDRVGIICDIEGSEKDLIDRELPELGETVRYLMVEMHPTILTSERVQELRMKLSRLGFEQRQSIGDSYFYMRND